MKKVLGILAVVSVVGLLALGWYLYRAGTVPAGQPALVALTQGNFEQLRSSFIAASPDVCIVLLLSPT